MQTNLSNFRGFLDLLGVTVVERTGSSFDGTSPVSGLLPVHMTRGRNIPTMNFNPKTAEHICTQTRIDEHALSITFSGVTQVL